MKLAWLAVAAVTALCSLPAQAQQPVYVGVYEPEYTDPAAGAVSYDPATKTYHYRHGTSRVRVSFAYDDGHWRALPHEDTALAKSPRDLDAYPATLDLRDLATGRVAGNVRRGEWFDGKGQLFYADVGVYDLSAPIPAALLRPTKGMGDWAGDYRYKPLILTTANGKAAPATADTFGRVRLPALLQALRAQVPTYTVCDKPEHKIRDQAWSAKDVHVLKAIHTPAGGGVDLQLNSRLDKCEFYDEGFPDKQGVIQCDYCGHWFLLSPDGKATALGNAMDFMGAGDFAGDGRTEWLFSQHAEDYDSYVLFADGFATRVDFSWSYH